MTLLSLLIISIAGGLGAVCRFICDSTIAKTRALPIAIIIVNISGSFAAGCVTGGLTHVLPEPYGLIITTGFLGGFTTFSTASVHTAEFFMRRAWKKAFITGIGQVLASILAAAAGLGVGITLW